MIIELVSQIKPTIIRVISTELSIVTVLLIIEYLKQTDKSLQTMKIFCF